MHGRNTSEPARGFVHSLAALCLLLVGFVPGRLDGQELPFRHFTHENEINPLPGTAVTALYQDQTGFIWFAVYGSGVVRYDGKHMEVFGREEGAEMAAFSIRQDGLGRLWLGGIAGVRCSERPLDDYGPGEKIRFTNILGTLQFPEKRVNQHDQIYVDPHGHVWTGDMESIIRYRYDAAGTLVADTMPLTDIAEHQGEVLSFSTLADGRIGAMTVSRFLLVISPEELTYEKILFDAQSDVNARAATLQMLLDPSGQLWGVRSNGEIWRLGADDTTYMPERFVGSAGLAIRSLLITSEGHFLAGGIGTGLLQFSATDPARPRIYDEANGLLDANIWDMLQDREGNIWIATNGGLSRLPGDYQAFGHYSARISEAGQILPEPGVTSVLPVMPWKDGEDPLLVIGTGGGLSFVRKDHTSTILRVEDGMLENAVLDLSLDERGRLWIAGRKGISCISKSRHALALPGFDAPIGFKLWEEPYWMAHMAFAHMNLTKTAKVARSETDRSLIEAVFVMGATSLWMLAGDQVYYFSPDRFLGRLAQRCIEIDEQGYLMMGDDSRGLIRTRFPLTLERLEGLTYNVPTVQRFQGIRSISDDVFVRHNVVAGQDTVTSISAMIWLDSVLWLGTAHGIVIMSGDSLEKVHHLEQEGERTNSTMGFVFDPRSGLLWAATVGGLLGIDPVEKVERKKVQKKDGLVADFPWGYQSVVAAPSGALYFCTSKGLSIYDPIKDRPDTLGPKVVLRDFQLTEDPSGTNIIEMEYAALSYTYEDGITFQTRLVGFDADWTDATRSTQMRYTNLPALGASRKYDFQLRAFDEFGNVTDTPLSYSFLVRPPWYLTWWAFVAYIVLLGGSVYAYVHYRTRALLKKQRQLEAAVAERTAEVVRQRDVIMEEKDRSEALLLNILPTEVAEELKLNGSSPARSFEEVTVLFTDFKGFTTISEQMSAGDLVEEINVCFQAFDHIVGKYQIEKIKTIGDAYLAAGGLQSPRKTGPKEVVLAALEMQAFMKAHRQQNSAIGAMSFEMRCGIHSGPVVAGIVGVKKFQYDIWGDTVNTAARMESSGEIDRVNISADTYRLLQNDPDLTFTYRGLISAKNKGDLQMYFVEPVAQTPTS